MTSPGQKDTQASRQDELGRDMTAANRDEGSKALQIKRWTVQEAPFQGFNSPPGRF